MYTRQEQINASFSKEKRMGTYNSVDLDEPKRGEVLVTGIIPQNFPAPPATKAREWSSESAPASAPGRAGERA